MIGDSVPWRDELLKSSMRLRRWSTQKGWTERTYFLAERDIMMGAYSIRRLIDSAKSSSLLPSMRIPTVRYPLVGRKPMVLDRFDPEQFYDLQKGTKTELGVGRLCNQIIHSFVFQIYLEEDATTSVVFVSDHDRGKHLHGIAFEILADLFDYVGREDIIDYSGTMLDGEQTIVNASNHDAVESGRARYVADHRVVAEWIYEEIPPFDEAVLQMVARRMAEVRKQRGDVESG
ncbi:MAG: hypothetical protein CMH35_00070 [Microbacterium sp.]|nr:hypothetical protein [Microbacterium sp.]